MVNPLFGVSNGESIDQSIEVHTDNVPTMNILGKFFKLLIGSCKRPAVEYCLNNMVILNQIKPDQL